MVDGVVFLLSSKLYKVYGSIDTTMNAFRAHRIAIDTCFGYNLVRRGCLPHIGTLTRFQERRCHVWSERIRTTLN